LSALLAWCTGRCCHAPHHTPHTPHCLTTTMPHAAASPSFGGRLLRAGRHHWKTRGFRAAKHAPTAAPASGAFQHSLPPVAWHSKQGRLPPKADPTRAGCTAAGWMALGRGKKHHTPIHTYNFPPLAPCNTKTSSSVDFQVWFSLSAFLVPPLTSSPLYGRRQEGRFAVRACTTSHFAHTALSTH